MIKATHSNKIQSYPKESQWEKGSKDYFESSTTSFYIQLPVTQSVMMEYLHECVTVLHLPTDYTTARKTPNFIL